MLMGHEQMAGKRTDGWGTDGWRKAQRAGEEKVVRAGADGWGGVDCWGRTMWLRGTDGWTETCGRGTHMAGGETYGWGRTYGWGGTYGLVRHIMTGRGTNG